MQENRPWTFQVDTYGLCVVVHLMLHNSYMEIEKKLSPEVVTFINPSHLLKDIGMLNSGGIYLQNCLTVAPALMTRSCCRI
ncbi:mitotic checkpoint serine/threonine-protein kinase BUB1 [Prunus yedoensis var. nudiflora]|uniref:Mitotic checkpoint serine/threonine-protein kinase BUB1 n=1 Tax=Prunus yedoensis var. nudiflora TaxID=2094558 RepID=A0A314YQF7_PRUYE|nr:mitotic checkpoint serine/threonine-protein kinase BUB1 [Prunus yedoensis var. nudiflora]